jgi:hypothetical protein
MLIEKDALVLQSAPAILRREAKPFCTLIRTFGEVPRAP